MYLFFFFKQKTAYEMRISDWSSDVCSSDLWCAEMDYVYAYLSYFGYIAGEKTMMGFWNEMKKLGKDMNPYRAGFLQFVGVAETREEAMKLYKEPAEYFYGRCLHVDPKWAQPAGYVTEATIRASVNSQIAQAAANFDVAREMEGIVDKGYIIVGSPDEEIGRASCRERVCSDVEISVVAVSLKTKNKK